ncbi:MAG: hypothetical protein JW751_24170 [Polyangiaceae bacterium]|nr:hypothetical protein [Polyangiaceae bacterium]
MTRGREHESRDKPRAVQVIVATHGHCFDGLASAALFTHLLDGLVTPARSPAAAFTYRCCGYGVTQARPEGSLVGDENAVLDYRYTQDPRLTWYFDHHRTAFAGRGDRESFATRSAGGQMFHDPDQSSCAKLIAEVGRGHFGVEAPELDELVDWADRVDSARFDSPEQAIARTDPVMRLVTVVEHWGDDAFYARLVPELRRRSLTEVAGLPEISEKYRPLGARHERFVRRVRAAAERLGRVVLVDLTHGVTEGAEKFVTYALYPDAVYSVVIGLRRSDVNVAVGFNPWSGTARDADISAICARHGGGGHPVVGGISFARAELDRARSVARAIAVELAG